MKVFIIKVSNEAVINTILKFTPFIHDGIYLFENEIEVGTPVFIYFGGDKSQITWEQGLKACGIITKAPFDKGYNKKNERYFKKEVFSKHLP